MAGIYQRDNYGAQLQAALAGAFDRRMANRQREDERLRRIASTGGDFLKMMGRAYESYDADRAGNADYDSARFDYVLGNDRSGLDKLRAEEEARRTLEAQQAFTARENKLNRALQQAENEANRRIQRKQLETDKADKELQWRRDYALAKNVYDDTVRRQTQGQASEKDVNEAWENYQYWQGKGITSGYLKQAVSSNPPQDTPKPPAGNNPPGSDVDAVHAQEEAIKRFDNFIKAENAEEAEKELETIKDEAKKATKQAELDKLKEKLAKREKAKAEEAQRRKEFSDNF